MYIKHAPATSHKLKHKNQVNSVYMYVCKYYVHDVSFKTTTFTFCTTNIWGKHTSRCRSELKSSSKCPHVTCGHFALLPEVDRHREVCLPQIFVGQKWFFCFWVGVKKMHLGVSKNIFVDKVVVGHGVCLYVKRIGWKSQNTVFTVKFSHFSEEHGLRSQRTIHVSLLVWFITTTWYTHMKESGCLKR